MSASSEEVGVELGALLGQHVRERRRELGKKLAEVARDAGVSTGYLSAIESGTSVPSLPVLARLSHALELSLAEMLRTSASPRIARGRLTDALGAQRLAIDGSHLQIVRLSCKPGGGGRAPLTLGDTDVFVFLWRGTLAVDVDGASYELRTGDALHCDRPRQLRWRNPGADRAVSLWAAASADRLRRRWRHDGA